MIDAIALQNEIMQHPEHIVTILDMLGYENIRDKGGYFQAVNIGGDNPSGFSVKKDNLQYTNWSHNKSGGIISLVMDIKECAFVQALSFIANWIGFKSDSIAHIIKPFSGFYEKIEKKNDDNLMNLTTYPDSILEPYKGLSLRFLHDGISFDVQEKYEIGFSHEDNAIAIPVRDLYGRIVGLKMRANDDRDSMKYWSEIPYKKSHIIYGAFQNYKSIDKKRCLIVGESEKMAAQLDSIGCHLGVGVGGHNISDAQAKLIKSLMCERIIVAFDNDVSEDEIVYNCEKLKTPNSLLKNKVQYICDKDGIYLNKKDSPVDHGKYIFERLLKNNLYTIGD